MTKIEAVWLDFDGVFTEKKGFLHSWDDIGRFRELTTRIVFDPQAPQIGLCTGKPAAWVEGAVEAWGFEMLETRLRGEPQSIGQSKFLHVVENGGVLYHYPKWEPTSVVLAERFAKPGALEQLAGIRKAILDGIPGSKSEHGKDASLSLNPPRGMSFEAFRERARDILSGLGIKALYLTPETEGQLYDAVDVVGRGIISVRPGEEIARQVASFPYDFSVSLSTTALDIMPFPINKGLGIYMAARMRLMDLEGTVAVGDTPGDHAAMRVVELPVAVANARPETIAFVKNRGGIVTRGAAFEGLHEILTAILEYKTIEGVREAYARQVA